MKKLSTLALSAVTALAITALPLASASARGWDHHGGHGGGYHGGYHGHGGIGPLGAILGVTAALVAAPFIYHEAVAPAYYPAPAYAYPQRVVYAYPSGYGYQQPVYAAPPAYYAPY